MNVADATKEVVSHFPYRKKGLMGFFRNWIHPMRGLRSTYELESSLKVELAALPVAIGLGQVFKLGWGRRLLLIGVVGQVILVELLNTGIEELVRDSHPRRSPHFRRAMDASAAAVMVSIGMAAIAAVYIVWDGVRSRYAVLSYDELVAKRIQAEEKIQRINKTRIGVGRNVSHKLWLHSRRAVAIARLSMIDATFNARDEG